jgi:hypothetical protein
LPTCGFVCTCPVGFTGLDCSIIMRACASFPCQNGGVCYDYTGFRYLCVCPTGFQGINCEIRIDLCNPNPCQNQGVCMSNTPGTYYCQCPPRFTGNNCEVPIRVCASNPCVNGVCRELLNGANYIYFCECTQGEWIRQI